MSEALFISDLHLSGERPDTVRLFFQFLSHRANRAGSLYILGDLFDAWVGDDLEAPPIPQIKAALRRLTEQGTRLYLMHGNRDFLLGKRFCADTGGELLADPSRIELQGLPTLLMHGDTLCTDDQDYQTFRLKIRAPDFIQQFLSLPIPQRLATAAEYRARSGEANSLKAEEIMDVNQQAVENIMRQHGVLRLIHGHTHRPNLHHFELDGSAALRYVLAEWHMDHAGYLSVGPNGWHTGTFTPQSQV